MLKLLFCKTKGDVAVAQVRVSFFICLFGMFLIALVEKLMPEIVFSLQFLVCRKLSFKMVWHQLFPLEQLLLVLWQIKNDILTGSFGFVGNKMALTIRKFTEIKSHFITYKSNENTTDLTTKLIKIVNVNVHKSNDNRIVSYEMANVVEDSGEGQCFL